MVKEESKWVKSAEELENIASENEQTGYKKEYILDYSGALALKHEDQNMANLSCYKKVIP